MIGVDSNSFLLIVIAGAVAALIVAVLPRRWAPPVIVAELLLGIVIGPHGLHVADIDPFTDFFASLGLGMLFFFAGYELDLRRLGAGPLRLAALGWGLSIVLAYGIGAALEASGIVLSFLYTGSALATTAIGTLIPVLRDAGELRGPFGRYLLAAGAIGEFGPIVLVTLVLSAANPVDNAALLLAFAALAFVVGVASVTGATRGWGLFERTIETSGQLAIRVVAVLVFGLAALATQFGFDVLLGGFVAGMIVREVVRGREVAIFESKLSAVGFGLLVPFFFVTSGMKFDFEALADSAGTLIKLPVFLVLMLLVRGVPALLLYRRVLVADDRIALGLFSATALPLVVAITAVALEEGHMRVTTATALVGAAILSTLVFPSAGLAVRGGILADRGRDPVRRR